MIRNRVLSDHSTEPSDLILPLNLINRTVPEKMSKTFFAMGTVMNLTFCGNYVQKALDEAAALISKLDSLLARMRTDSEITQLNISTNNRWIKVHDDTNAVLREALLYAEKTNGAYDPAIGALVDLWDIKHCDNRDEQELPDGAKIQETLLICDYRHIETDHAGHYRVLNSASIDLGGIAKGYAADRVYELCRQQEISSALISLGTSSLAAMGVKPDGNPWKIGLKGIDENKNACFGVVYLKDQFLSTSGDYEQYFMKDSRRYHHIIDKKTGYPSNSGLRSVTVISNNGALSEAYSTALLIMGLDKALSFQKSEGGFEAIFVTSDKHVVCTEGILSKFKFRGKTLGYHCNQI
ncbi:MAG TPA: FAD:protein FMN transferase [Desulfosporosinus sp.]|nr:FAD:protein FMN transferase [Desulfosporosinus sp.]